MWIIYYTGNMWAQNWRSVADLVLPFPAKPKGDVSSEMLRQGYTPLR
jgi:peptidyl-dipeptidase A